jgi:hypothetical protein
MCRIRLKSKLAATLNGLNVSHVSVGDVIEVSDSMASMMLAEGWAEPFNDQPDDHGTAPYLSTAGAPHGTNSQ